MYTETDAPAAALGRYPVRMEIADNRPTIATHVCIGGALDGKCFDPGTSGSWFKHEGGVYHRRTLAGRDTLFAFWIAAGHNDDDGIIGALLARYVSR